ncbi:hypothetical protein [Pseudoruegeria sp. HB172150]|uniref:hypothetical protein n=1 Tax=Pseudoruegeria sp. HB172150 TaxID=2721164 RepID=UPI001554450C|nr:hypothetical protein [Pseudoruegeria sp. HB172150]
MGIVRLFLVLCLTAGQAAAGTWPRGEGNTFVALSYAGTGDPQTLRTPEFDPAGYLTLLVERGWTPRLTFGLDAGYGDSGDYKAVLFGSYAIGPQDARNRYAFHAGAGSTRYGDVSEPIAYLGASFGRGMETPLGPGWIAADLYAYYRVSSQDIVTKADVTFGITAQEGRKLLLQLQAGKYPDSDPYLRAVPSLVVELAPGRHVEVGVQIGISGERDVGMKLGTWLEF